MATGFAQDRQAIGQSLAGINDLTTSTARLLTDIRPGLRDDITQLGALSKNLNDSRDVVDGVLQRLPTKLDRIIGTATYGGWFNFYLCGAKGRVTASGTPIDVGPLTDPVGNFQLINPAPRCQFEANP
jgi:phospholipid/cholesterol/gamma-HCH transport system substrate-binding protein